MDQGSSLQHQVRRRRVFYIPGYDPIHPRRYRELYRKEGAAQAEISGYRLALQPKRGGGGYGWTVLAETDGTRTEADVEVLVWSDIVRSSMTASIPGTYGQLLRTAWIYITSGALRRLMRLRKGPVIAALYPVGMLLLQALLALLLAWGVARTAGLLAAAAGLQGQAGAALGWGLGLGAGYALLRWFKARDGRFFAYYLMHDYAHAAALRGAIAPQMEARMDAFRGRIAAAMEDASVDEVLVVGHSSGAHVAVTVLAA